MTGYRIDGLLSEQAQASGPRTTVSSVSFLRIDNQYKLISPSDLIALLRRLPVLQRLVLANMMPMRPGEFKECLDVVAPTLTSFSLNDDRPDDHRLRSWEDDAVSGLVHLKELEFGGVPVTPALFDMLPPGLERLAFFGNAMKFLPTPEIATWLRRDPFPLRGSLKRFDFGGEFWTNTFLGGPEALAYLGRLCDGLNIEWKHTGYKVEEEDDDILLLL
jgi:hypothetical protein